jgi:hypothetical protein
MRYQVGVVWEKDVDDGKSTNAYVFTSFGGENIL